MKMKTYRIVFCAAVLLPFLASAAPAQQTPEPEKGPVVKVQVVLSRYEQLQPTGERKTSSLPFTMLATSNGDKVVNFQYVDVGSNVDCTVKTAANGRFNIILSIQDRSALEKPAMVGSGANATAQPVLRNFQYTNSILLKDGESKQFVAASDKGSGDIVKVDVTINVEK